MESFKCGLTTHFTTHKQKSYWVRVDRTFCQQAHLGLVEVGKLGKWEHPPENINLIYML